MFTDMVGYSALAQRDEALSIRLLAEQRKIVRVVLPLFGGEEVKTIGDAFLVVFADAKVSAGGKTIPFEEVVMQAYTDRISLSAMVDVFNALNANTELNIRHTTGRLTISETGVSVPAFQTPITILPPRIARFSARISW